MSTTAGWGRKGVKSFCPIFTWVWGVVGLGGGIAAL